MPLARPRTTLAVSHCWNGVSPENWTGVAARADEAAVGAHRGADAGGGVALLLHHGGDAAGVGGRRGEELALLEDPLAQLVDPHGVDEPLHAGAQLVVAVAVVVLHPQHRLDGGEQVLAGGELLQRLRRVRVRAQTAGHEHAEPGFEGAVGPGPVHRDDAGVVEHRLAAVGGAAREVDLELAGEALRDGVAEEQVLGGLRPRADVEHLVGARAGEVAARDVAHGVAAGLAAGEADRGEEPQHLGGLLELHEVELRVLAGGEVPPAPRVALGDVAEHLELVGFDPPVGDLHPHHLVVAALALPVDALVEAEDPERVVVDLAREVAAHAVLEGLQLLLDLGVERMGAELSHVDRHR